MKYHSDQVVLNVEGLVGKVREGLVLPAFMPLRVLLFEHGGFHVVGLITEAASPLCAPIQVLLLEFQLFASIL